MFHVTVRTLVRVLCDRRVVGRGLRLEKQLDAACKLFRKMTTIISKTFGYSVYNCLEKRPPSSRKHLNDVHHLENTWIQCVKLFRKTTTINVKTLAYSVYNCAEERQSSSRKHWDTVWKVVPRNDHHHRAVFWCKIMLGFWFHSLILLSGLGSCAPIVVHRRSDLYLNRWKNKLIGPIFCFCANLVFQNTRKNSTINREWSNAWLFSAGLQVNLQCCHYPKWRSFECVTRGIHLSPGVACSGVCKFLSV